MESALERRTAASLAADLVRPVRCAVELFRFSTVRLDLRENTTRTTETLQALWRATARQSGGDPPTRARRPGMAAWLLAELARPARRRPRPGRRFRRGRGDARHASRSCRDARASSTARPSARFILSMTRSVDRRARRLSARQGGAAPILDAAGTEICPLPIVPLFETIDDLRAAPAIMRELLVGPAGPPQRAAGRAACRR